MGLTFDRLTAEHGEWAERNFPGSTDNEPFHGIVEELGELAGALIAQEEALDRDDELGAAKAVLEVKDAVADATIFLCDYARRRGLSISAILADPFGYTVGTLSRLQDEASMGADTLSDPILELVRAVGQLAHARLKARQGIRGGTPAQLAAERGAVGRIAVWLSVLCSREGIDYETAVAETWAVVKCRDWLANPETGRAPEPASLVTSHDEWIEWLRTHHPAPTAPAEPEVYPAEAAIPVRSTMPYEV